MNPDFWGLISHRMILNHQSCCISVNVLMASLQNAYCLPINWFWIGCSGHESRNGWQWVWVLHGGISWSNDITIYNIWQIFWIPLAHHKSLVGLLLSIIYMFIQGLSWNHGWNVTKHLFSLPSRHKHLGFVHHPKVHFTWYSSEECFTRNFRDTDKWSMFPL